MGLENVVGASGLRIRRAFYASVAAVGLAACGSGKGNVEVGAEANQPAEPYTIENFRQIVMFDGKEIRLENLVPPQYQSADAATTAENGKVEAQSLSGIVADTAQTAPAQAPIEQPISPYQEKNILAAPSPEPEPVSEVVMSEARKAVKPLYEKLGEEGLKDVGRIDIRQTATATSYILAEQGSGTMLREVTIPRLSKEDHDDHNFQGSIFGIGGVRDGLVRENLVSATANLGYNFNKGNRTDGLFLFPNARVTVAKQVSEIPWGNYVEGAIGPQYSKGAFTVGVEAGYRALIGGTGPHGGFGQLYGYFWKRQDLTKLSDSKNFPMQPYITHFGALTVDSLTDNGQLNWRSEPNLELYRNGKWNFGVFAAGSFNYDIVNEPWNRFVQADAGVKIGYDPVTVSLSMGYRKSLNAGESYSIREVLPTIWVGLDLNSTNNSAKKSK